MEVVYRHQAEISKRRKKVERRFNKLKVIKRDQGKKLEEQEIGGLLKVRLEEEDFGLFKRYDGGVTSGVIYIGGDNIAEYPDDNEVRVEQLEESFHSLNSDSSLSEIHGFELEER